MDTFWLFNAQLITPQTIHRGSVQVSHGRITAISHSASQRRGGINLHGAYLALGFIDLHVWGPPETVSREIARGGATSFLTTLGPEPVKSLTRSVSQRATTPNLPGAECLGIHLEGPFVNPVRAGALSRSSMRRPLARELNQLWAASHKRLRLLTVAPELVGAQEAIRWCRRHRIIASLGHSDALANVAQAAVDAGASAVTHVFNGMRPFYHRKPGLLDVALTDPRLVTMAILDGVHISPPAFRLLVRAKGIEKVALVTDSIAHQGWDVVKHSGAFYLKNGTLAGSALTMIEAVRNAVQLGGLSILEAVRMASEVPARLLGLAHTHGRLVDGARADLVAFDTRFRVLMTMVNGRLVYRSVRGQTPFGEQVSLRGLTPVLW